MALKAIWYHIMYIIILLWEAYFIRLVINFNYYFNKNIIRYQFMAVFKPKVFNG